MLKKIVFLFLMCGRLMAYEFLIAFGDSLPPYVIPETNNGIEVDIIRQSFFEQGINIESRYLPFARIYQELKSRRVDCAATLNVLSDSLQGLYFSDTYIEYQNYILGLEEFSEEVKSLDELKNKKVISFQNATKYLGAEFKKYAESNSNYKEMADQEKQVKMLHRKMIELIVIDKNIYEYYAKNIRNKQKIKIVYKFPATKYNVGFWDQNLRDKFNLGLMEVKKGNRIEEIYDMYLK